VLGPRRTTGLSLELAGMRYELNQANRSGIEASRTRVVRGVAVRTEPRSIEDWLNEVSGALSAELERTGDGRAALERLLHS